MRIVALFALFVVICASFVLGEESVESPADDWTDKAQSALDKTVVVAKDVGNTVAEGTKSGFDATRQYFRNNTVGDIADDVADGAKKVGQGIADGAKKAWKGVTDFFSSD